MDLEVNHFLQDLSEKGVCLESMSKVLGDPGVVAILREAHARVEAANHARTQFLANMSHEIRTPLNAIMGFTELLLDPDVSANDRWKSVDIIRKNCHRLLRTVDEILDISKVDSEGLELKVAEASLMDLLNDVKAALSVQAAKKGIALLFELQSRVPERVVTDMARVRQILLNIIGNAIKFTPQGEVRLVTRFVASGDGKTHLEFLISDTGIGIVQSAQEQVFQPFSQVDSSSTRPFGGTGLGLALSRRLARAMGGDVTLLQSCPGGGSTFVFCVQIEVSENVSWLGGQEFHAGSEASVLRGKSILLVEDAEDNQFLIQQFLSRTGLLIEVASNGEEGVKKALSQDFAVVLMDIQMPVMDG